MINRDVAGLGPAQDLVHVIAHATPELAEIGAIAHQPARLHLLTIAIDPQQAALLCQLDNQMTVRKMVGASLTISASGDSGVISANTRRYSDRVDSRSSIGSTDNSNRRHRSCCRQDAPGSHRGVPFGLGLGSVVDCLVGQDPEITAHAPRD